MPSTDPITTITNYCYCLIVSYTSILTQYTASSYRNAQLSQLDLVLTSFQLWNVIHAYKKEDRCRRNLHETALLIFLASQVL